MSIQTTAKSRVFIGNPNATIALLNEYEGEDWTEIKEVEDLGEWGAEGTEVTFLSLADGHVRRRKGSIDSGTVALIVGRDPSDPGQNKTRAAVEDWMPYSFKVVLNDKPTPTGENTVFYFRAPVMSARNSFGTADEITKTTFSLGIDGAILEVPAAPVVTMSPASGALAGASEGNAYSATVTASGGIGTVSYAVTAGTLPAGLTLNAATGAISGTPSAAGTSNFTITATYTGSGEAEGEYSIVVSA
ncbi:Ig domain-containing protein [Shinella daejeonensis]|uniref:Ig domain-containing protein n=1 Tax=Shinella daejeonensis TaxID=659017 RepID=UPI0020C805A6|nr:Ig domain-containing protein [Shinella daejeonensis]MCP8894334.1 Ig domain-containing protein [Shinella daejeonensis]